MSEEQIATHPEAPFLLGKIMELKEALDKQVPDISNLLKVIHEKVRSTPELAMILTDEQMNACVRAYEKQSQSIVIQDKMKSTKKLKANDITTDMI